METWQTEINLEKLGQKVFKLKKQIHVPQQDVTLVCLCPLILHQHNASAGVSLSFK